MAKRQPDLRKLAKRQRWLIWLILITVFTQFAQFSPIIGRLIGPYIGLFIILQVILWILGVIGIVMVVIAQGTNPAVTALTGLFMLAPCANILLLLLVSSSVNRTFKRAGIRVGLMGVNETDLERALNPMLCKGCGYDLTGNTSGICPECGRPIPTYLCTNCNRLVDGKQGQLCPECLHFLG